MCEWRRIRTESLCVATNVGIHYTDISDVWASEMRKSSSNYSNKKQINLRPIKAGGKKYVAVSTVFKGVVIWSGMNL